MAQGKQAEAINFLSQELKKNPQNLAAHFNLGNIYQQQNNNRKAEKHYQAILAEQPDNIVILNNLAWIYHQQNNPKSLALAERAYKNAPKSATVADTYAAILVKQGDLVNGLKIFERAGKLAPQNYDIQYHLADAYSLSGQHKQSISILKTITRSEQNFSEKDASISLLKKFE
jgi:predicted Zn-dependent protease